MPILFPYDNEGEFPISIVYRYDAANVGLSDGQLIIPHNCGELLHDSKWIVLPTDTRPLSKANAKILEPDTDRPESVKETDLEDTEDERTHTTPTGANTAEKVDTESTSPTKGGAGKKESGANQADTITPTMKMKLRGPQSRLAPPKILERTTSLPTLTQPNQS